MRVVAFCATAALLVGVVFGIAPAFQATRCAPTEAMGADSRTTTGGGGRLRNLLVVGEVATAVLLLFGAGLLLRTLIAVQSYDRGYRAESVLTMLVDPLGSAYPTPEKLQQFFDQVEAEVRAVPGVADVGWSIRLAARRIDVRRIPVPLRNRRRCAARRRAQADDRVSDRQPDVLFDARTADRGRPRIRRARRHGQSARRDRQ